jgi:hypothetical protein
MKLIAVIEPTIELKEIEDNLIVYWQHKGNDLDYYEVVGDGEANLGGENAVSVDGLHRSMNLFRERTFWAFLRGASQPGVLFEIRDDFARVIKEGMPVHIIYSRFYDVGVTKKFSEFSKRVSCSEYWELMPGLEFVHEFDHCKTTVFLGQLGGSRRAWASSESSDVFRTRVTEFVGSSEFWKNVSFPDLERSVTTSANMDIDRVMDGEEVGKLIAEVEASLYCGYKGIVERMMITCDNRPEAGSFPERCKEIVLRRYEQSTLFADKMIIYPVTMNVHKLRAIKDEVFGTAFENLEIPLMTSSWKGAKFTAKRFFENGQRLIRMRLAGKEDVCRTLLKEMEEELGVEIKIESCK